MDTIKKLREETGLSFAEIKKALDANAGDETAARVALAERSAVQAAKRADRDIDAGAVAAYIHSSGVIGVMVKLGCETDFVGKNDEFKALAYDIAMHICAMNPESREDLMIQSFIKDASLTIQGRLDAAVSKFGENVQLVDYVRYSI